METGSLDTSFTYTADRDSQQLEYRCVTNGSADGLVWRYNNQEYTNPLSPYLFYAAVGSVGTFSVACYSVSDKQGAISLTIKGEYSTIANSPVTPVPTQMTLDSCWSILASDRCTLSALG